MKNSTLVFIILLVNCIGLFIWFQPLISLYISLIILALAILFYLLYCLLELGMYEEDYGNKKYNYTILPKKYNIFAIIIDWINSFPQIIKKK